MKKYFFLFLILGFLITPFFPSAQGLPSVILFHGEECPHCQDEREFLEQLKQEMPELEIVEYEVWHNEENRKIFEDVAKRLGIEKLVVPITIVGDQYLIGFDSPENSGEKIREMIKDSDTEFPSGFSLPILGEINVNKLSLPVLTAVLGTLDGFNPCSMWALLVLLTLVISTGSRRKVWIVGGVFILTSAVSYYLFVFLWLNAFVLVGYLAITRIIVGIIALAAGAYAIKEYLTFRPGVCEISSPEEQQKITERIKNVLRSASFPALIIGVIGIAFSVNLIELLCSLGIPVVYTQALALHNLPALTNYLYILGYVFFYILDDVIVLFIAGFAMKFFHLNTRYSQYSRLIAGILMLILGALFILKPEILVFG